MKHAITTIILKSIYESCWIEIKHINKNHIQKKFWISIKKIDLKEQFFICDSLSLDSKKEEIIENKIYLKNILSAKLLENTYFENNTFLLNFLHDHYLETKEMFPSFNYENILSYLEKCVKNDTIKYKVDLEAILGIDEDSFKDCDELVLNKNQKNTIKYNIVDKLQSTNSH